MDKCKKVYYLNALLKENTGPKIIELINRKLKTSIIKVLIQKNHKITSLNIVLTIKSTTVWQ